MPLQSVGVNSEPQIRDDLPHLSRFWIFDFLATGPGQVRRLKFLTITSYDGTKLNADASLPLDLEQPLKICKIARARKHARPNVLVASLSVCMLLYVHRPHYMR